MCVRGTSAHVFRRVRHPAGGQWDTEPSYLPGSDCFHRQNKFLGWLFIRPSLLFLSVLIFLLIKFIIASCGFFFQKFILKMQLSFVTQEKTAFPKTNWESRFMDESWMSKISNQSACYKRRGCCPKKHRAVRSIASSCSVLLFSNHSFSPFCRAICDADIFRNVKEHLHRLLGAFFIESIFIDV